MPLLGGNSALGFRANRSIDLTAHHPVARITGHHAPATRSVLLPREGRRKSETDAPSEAQKQDGGRNMSHRSMYSRGGNKPVEFPIDIEIPEGVFPASKPHVVLIDECTKDSPKEIAVSASAEHRQQHSSDTD